MGWEPCPPPSLIGKMEKPNKIKGVTRGWEEKRGGAPGPDVEAQGLGWGRLSPRDKGSFGLKCWGVLPPAHCDAKSERGIVCLDAGRGAHACAHGGADR